MSESEVRSSNIWKSRDTLFTFQTGISRRGSVFDPRHDECLPFDKVMHSVPCRKPPTQSISQCHVEKGVCGTCDIFEKGNTLPQ
ncbi:hypothetical protein CDAR_274091 [Caerostris darwini]|uniref:Uncharacterized protein n=1 Tax=Caerostris darwini TaxID=1538125 RepID=A0AAV4RDP4_9ARAC|nr:hypothetical protein CDAR_274091 [Caerostris darwini]